MRAASWLNVRVCPVRSGGRETVTLATVSKLGRADLARHAQSLLLAAVHVRDAIHKRDEEVEPRIQDLLELAEPLHDVRSLLRHDHQTLRAADARVGIQSTRARVGIQSRRARPTASVWRSLTVFHGVSRRLK